MRPIRIILSACLLALATVAPALETPLILSAGSNAAVIDPSLGTLTTIEVISSGSTRKAFVNWLMDLDQLQRRPFAERNGESFSTLRVGHPSIKPTPEEFIQIFPSKPTKAQTEAGQKDLQSQVREAEKAFWEQEHTYDGIVRGAFSGQYLMLVIPSSRAVLFYQNSGKESLDLLGYSQFSPLLYVPSAWKSTPDPAQLVQGLKLDEEEKKAIEGALHAREDGSAAAAAKSEIWCTNIGETFIVVDSANQKIWAYEIKGQTVAVTSVRSMGVDLIAPGFQTRPLDQDGIEQFGKLYAGQLKEIGVAKLDWPYVQAFISAQQVGDATKAGALQANLVSNQIVLNFTAQRKLVTYEYRSGVGINLTSVRDMTVDLGLTMLARHISEKTLARGAYNDAVKSKTGNILSLMTYALGLDPSLHTEAQKNNALKNALKADWDKLIADAVKAEETAKAKHDAIDAAAEAERKRLKEKKKKG